MRKCRQGVLSQGRAYSEDSVHGGFNHRSCRRSESAEQNNVGRSFQSHTSTPEPPRPQPAARASVVSGHVKARTRSACKPVRSLGKAARPSRHSLRLSVWSQPPARDP